jgi:hypothetical protein
MKTIIKDHCYLRYIPTLADITIDVWTAGGKAPIV